MKKLILALLLLSAITSFAQTDKDSLLSADREIILDKLRLMRYLDDKVQSYYATCMTKEQAAMRDQKFPYYFTSQIIKNNPSSVNIKKYLNFDYGEFVAITWRDFIKAVHKKNIDEFVNLTDKYGYLSPDRLELPKGERRDVAFILYVIRNSSRDKDVEKLLKEERKIGNLSERDYEEFKFFLQRKTVITQRDVAKLAKKGIKVSIPDESIRVKPADPF